jgi:hypothetical protein
MVRLIGQHGAIVNGRCEEKRPREAVAKLRLALHPKP